MPLDHNLIKGLRELFKATFQDRKEGAFTNHEITDDLCDLAHIGLRFKTPKEVYRIGTMANKVDGRNIAVVFDEEGKPLQLATVVTFLNDRAAVFSHMDEMYDKVGVKRGDMGMLISKASINHGKSIVREFIKGNISAGKMGHLLGFSNEEIESLRVRCRCIEFEEKE